MSVARQAPVKVCLFYFLFFTKWWPFKKYWKCLLLHLKSSFHSRDFQVFVFPSSPLFLLVDHCFRGWLKKNLKVYRVISCLNKNLITHFVWYLEKGKRCDIETLSIDQVHFYGKMKVNQSLFRLQNKFRRIPL